MHRHTKNIISAGKPLSQAKKAMIMVHGRGATAENILSIAEYLEVENFALLAPEATHQVWYPYSFMAPVAQNEPGLSTGLEVMGQLVEDIKAAGLNDQDIYFLGFSQGGCLVSEFLARNATEYGGAFIYSGGLIGQTLDRSNYQGEFGGMPYLVGCSDIDPHIPLNRVQESVEVFNEMGASVTERIYPNAPHTVFEDEIKLTNQILIERR